VPAGAQVAFRPPAARLVVMVDDTGVDGVGGRDGAGVVERARRLVGDADRVAVLTGAGISTESGIPDYRGPKGVWTRNPGAEKTAHISYYLADAAVRRRSWRNRLDSPAWRAEPNAGHRALVDLERRGRLVALLTQNIDGLHQEAGSDPDLVVEVHGTIRSWVCMSCDATGPMPELLDRVRLGEDDPACRGVGPDGAHCGGILKSATVSFGQNLDPADLERAEEAALACDLFLAVGTSLTVNPIAQVVPLARQAGATVVIVNAEPTPFDGLAAEVLRGPIGEVLPAVVARG
jgi:NAD-dependent deacetylase